MSFQIPALKALTPREMDPEMDPGYPSTAFRGCRDDNTTIFLFLAEVFQTSQLYRLLFLLITH